jgi:membrane-associated protease RseP (regulator of RpoE activity)
MRIAMTIVFCLFAAGTVFAAPADPKPSDPQGSVDIVTSVGRGRLGITAISISPELRSYFHAPNDRGVLVDAVQPDSPAAHAGLQVGDVVIAVEGAPTKSAGDVLDALAQHKKGDTVVIEVVRAGKRVGLKATLDRDPARAWHGTLGGGNHDLDFEQLFRGFDSAPNGWQQQMDDMRKHMEQLDRRLHKLERT